MNSKRALRHLQASAKDSTTLVGSPKMPLPTKKVLKGSNDVSKPPKTDGKENSVSTTRSKRKNAGGKSNKVIKEVPIKKATKNSKPKPEKAKIIPKLDETVTLNQSRIETYFSSDNTISNSSVQQDSNVENIGSIAVNKSIHEEFLSSKSPTRSYWQNLAEERRIALQKSLLENEMLSDQINVLETENLLIKSALEAAEELLKQEGLWD